MWLAKWRAKRACILLSVIRQSVSHPPPRPLLPSRGWSCRRASGRTGRGLWWFLGWGGAGPRTVCTTRPLRGPEENEKRGHKQGRQRSWKCMNPTQKRVLGHTAAALHIKQRTRHARLIWLCIECATIVFSVWSPALISTGLRCSNTVPWTNNREACEQQKLSYVDISTHTSKNTNHKHSDKSTTSSHDN